MSELTPDAIAQRQFKAAFRGIDQEEVKAFLSVLATELQEARAERDRLANQLADLGGRDLRNEFDTVGVEVAAVLQAAREAAEAMRERAAADAQRWRSETMSEAEKKKLSARSDSEQMRADAWATATEMLESVQSEVLRLRTAAEQQNLKLIGDAERESHRLLSVARRESEEMTRQAKMESERLVAEAQIRYDQILQAAEKQVEVTQEKASLLEKRRAELAAELEAVRHALANAGAELDDKREGLGLSPVTQPPEPPERQVSVETEEPAEMVEVNNPYGDSGVVRIVRPANRGSSTPRPEKTDETSGPEVKVVSASELNKRLAEEEKQAHRPRFQSEIAEKQADPNEVNSSEVFVSDFFGARPTTKPTVDLGELDEIRIISADELKHRIEGGAPDSEPGDSAGQEPDSDSEEESQVEPHEAGVAETEPHTDEMGFVETLSPDSVSPFGHNVKLVDPRKRAEMAKPEPVESDELTHDKLFDGVEDLFARLREPIGKEGSEAKEKGGATPKEGSDRRGDGEEDSEGSGGEKPKPKSKSEPILDLTPKPTGHPDPFDMRDRLLLPIANRSLRNLKRQLTEETNISLEEVRSKKKWKPDIDRLKSRVRADLVVLAAESFGAGYAAAEESLGERVTRPPTPKTEVVEEFADDLATAIQAALEEGREAGQGPQQLGATISRVFRAWRTDECERRVRTISFTAYHQGLASTLELAGKQFAWVIAGKGCDKCRAASSVGDKTILPPLHPGCDCAIALP